MHIDLVRIIIQLLIVTCLPALAIRLSRKFTVIRIVGPILLCYGVGILLSVTAGRFLDRAMATGIAEALIPLAIPLLLFSTDLKKWGTLAGKTVLSFTLAAIAVILATTAGFLLFHGRVEGAHQLSGMLTGLYTGGTPNLFAIGMAVGARDEFIILANTVDMVVGGAYFLLLVFLLRMVTAGKTLHKRRRETKPSEEPSSPERIPAVSGREHFFGGVKPLALVLPVLLALLGTGAGVGAAILLTGSMHVAVVILVVTTVGIAGSLIPRIRAIRGTYQSGQYLILMFSTALGMSFDATAIPAAGGTTALYILFVMLAAILVHFILSALFRIEWRLTVVTSTAAIYGPPFVNPVVDALDRPDLLAPGLLSGLVGYDVGNYLGIAISYGLSRLPI